MNDTGDSPTVKDNPFTNHQLPLGVRLFMKAARITFRVTGWVSPRLAGLLAVRLFMIPPKFPIPRRELKIRQSATLTLHEIHGDSSGKRTNMLIASQTIAGIVEREGPFKAVVGHSFGCGIALLAIDRYRIPSDKVILFSCFTDTLWISQQFASAFAISDRVIEAMRKIAMGRYADHFDKP
ncbi:MAG: alpha/beta hydrolase [Candidatus Thiodiazotropha sp.]